ncbi:FUSC family protein [Idiomarina abyssalis]|uniref:FUSC family protein n=1 Tax=Idiomarina abyssalis TaxID=86102 RepID=A0A8I1GD69_9GAMM|nr:FUSC family protein [Idiomarina abyssalis]MBJ7266117.1 FUSC family protein [Idiomarina abyssalis]MBJ7272826.1 FUSC family protein [Idiomarina abyssalis]MBJ7316256.1 FUSC family protein [Idiomarina abyssalis]
MKDKLAQWGFDYVRLRFGFRTGIAACLSLVFAWALGLEHPQWAAMTVWAVSQPTRGLLVEKAAYRALGTLLGTMFGMVLVVSAGGEIIWLVIGLSLWVTLCVYTGNLLHGLISYGTILAGYSASMVVLLTQSPDALMPLGIDRLLTVFVGIMTSLVIGWAFTYKRAEQTLINQLRRLTAANLQDISHYFAEPDKVSLNLSEKLSQLAAIEAQLLDHGTGSVSAHESAKTLRLVINSQLGFFTELNIQEPENNKEVSGHLLESSNKLNASAKRSEIIEPLRKALKLIKNDALKRRFSEFVEATNDRLSFRDSGKTASSTLLTKTILHRDWRGARQAAIRTLVIMSLIGAAWWYTEWFQLAYLMLGASVMLTLFSTADNPALTMKYVFFGQCAGALTAILIQAAVWQYQDAIFWMLVALMPVILLAGFPMSHQKTANGSMDFNLVFLLLMQPSVAYSFHLGHSITIALAVVAAPLLALVAYRLIYPTSLKARYQTLLQTLTEEIDQLDTEKLTESQYKRRKARFYHRVIKLTQISDKLGLKEKDSIIEHLLTGQKRLNSTG